MQAAEDGAAGLPSSSPALCCFISPPAGSSGVWRRRYLLLPVGRGAGDPGLPAATPGASGPGCDKEAARAQACWAGRRKGRPLPRTLQGGFLKPAPRWHRDRAFGNASSRGRSALCALRPCGANTGLSVAGGPETLRRPARPLRPGRGAQPQLAWGTDPGLGRWDRCQGRGMLEKAGKRRLGLRAPRAGLLEMGVSGRRVSGSSQTMRLRAHNRGARSWGGGPGPHRPRLGLPRRPQLPFFSTAPLRGDERMSPDARLTDRWALAPGLL